MLVLGAILDIEGARPAYVRLRNGRVTEVGSPGTEGRRARERRVRGIVVPPLVNAHTHLGDSVSVREPPPGPVSKLIQPPHGYKFRLLATTSRSQKTAAIRGALERMEHDGVAAVVDFREEGRPGVELLRDAARGSALRVLALGRPLARPVDKSELHSLLGVADGVGLSSARDETDETRRTVARACRTAGKRFALHASEAVRERPERYLDPHPDLLIHLVKATRDDLVAVREDRVSVAVCPRSNALFARQPDLESMERLGLSVLLGTDNAMFHAPSLWREMEFAYVASRLRRRPVSAAFLANASLVEPWKWLGAPENALVVPGMPVAPLVLRLPPDDPAYQVVTRATEHLMVRSRTPERGRGLSR
ncbi:MAG TPA: amidohydrolase family protein [Thermoplasmata archaeon]|nr:amidohydrolase family protein [Thermoplasmata archaeon]